MIPALVTLVMGIVLGYLAQRSRICFIGGLRDFILVHDTELLKGAIAFFVTAWLAFSVAGSFGLLDWQQAPAGAAATGAASGMAMSASAPRLDLSGINWQRWALIGAAGIALGLCSTLANGCPTRQHVLAAQGVRDSRLYLVGFYLGVVIFYLATRPLLARFM